MMQTEASFLIEWISKGAISTFEGELTLDCVKRSDLEVLNNVRFQNCEFVIYDMLGAEFSGLDLADSHELAFTDAIRSFDKPKLKMVLIVDNELSVFFAEEYIRETKKLYSAWEFKVFDNIDDAKAWVLG